MKTLYVTDLDGTLLNKEDRISEYTLEVINKLIGGGVHFTYATARSLVSAGEVTEGLKINMPVIVHNGTFILDPLTNEVVYSLGFRDEERQFISELVAAHHISPIVYACINGQQRVSWLTHGENVGIKHYLSKRRGDKRLNPLSEGANLYEGDVFYFTCIGEREELLPIYTALKDHKDYTCILQQELYREEYWCEIMPKQATKANAIRVLKEMYQCDQVISFGDRLNDMPMFHISNECYAVENAVPELKAIASRIIGSNEEDGVAKWLQEHCIIGK